MLARVRTQSVCVCVYTVDALCRCMHSLSSCTDTHKTPNARAQACAHPRSHPYLNQPLTHALSHNTADPLWQCMHYKSTCTYTPTPIPRCPPPSHDTHPPLPHPHTCSCPAEHAEKSLPVPYLQSTQASEEGLVKAHGSVLTVCYSAAAHGGVEQEIRR